MSNEYQSLRLKNVVHKLRYGVQPMLVEAGGDQTITYSETPFPHFEVLPSGVQIPLHNVSSAIPKDANVASKHAKTVGAMKEARLAKAAKQKKDADAAE
jgi:hypothetical protein